VNDTRLYLIQLDGHVSEETINTNSPIEALVTPKGTSTEIALQTDQSGLIGLLRHLHARGLVLLTITGSPEPSGASNVK
jgi:hypothetical protein